MLLRLFYQSLRSLQSPQLIGIMLVTMLVTTLLLIVFVIGVVYGVHDIAFFKSHLPSWAIQLLGGIGASLLAWLLFALMLPMIAGFFTERIVNCVERQEYSGTTIVSPPETARWLIYDTVTVLTALVLTLVSLPLYLIPGMNLIIYYGLNGYLLGRSFFTIVARHYASFNSVMDYMRSFRIIILAVGVVLTLATNIPFINLFAPFLAIIFMIHFSRQCTSITRL